MGFDKVGPISKYLISKFKKKEKKNKKKICERYDKKTLLRNDVL